MAAGDVAWLLTASSMVLFMTVPGLALFYGGLVRARSVVSTMMYSLLAFALVSVVWVLLGFGIAFGSDIAGFIGNPVDYLRWLAQPTPSTGDIPLPVIIGFQGMFAAIATAIISSAVVERARIEAWALYAILWVLLVYSVIAHWVWGGGWAQKLPELLGIPEALDFAGGVVVHIASGFSALMLALLLGRRRTAREVEPVPHNIPLVLIGTGILWFGWMGFNAGSALAADATAANAWLVTNTAAAAGAITWFLLSLAVTGRASSVAFASGAVAGLVAITPCAGYVGPLDALPIGAVASIVSYMAMNWRIRKGIDETLDAWAVHGMSGLWGSIAAGIFANPAVSSHAGLLYGNPVQLASQILTSVAAIAYAMIATVVIYYVVEALVGWRVPVEAEYVGLDAAEYGEQAYLTM
ncbi:ammonium transporter [Pyrolobus fumarii]|uniref:ammonium transporter n=1 Tax=Pyrolobus fumarii TaxID=54252 RepID=UPI000B02DE19|nr:ammonium transporter [Pyrolobus fumarii]